MAYFHPRRGSVSNASYRHAPQQKVCAVYSVQERIAAFEESMDAANTPASSFRSPKPASERRFSASLTQNMKSLSLSMPSPSFRPAETQRSSMPFHQKNMMMKSAMKANTDIYSNISASFTSSKQSFNSYRRTESTALVKSETQQSKVTSFSREVRRNSNVSLTQQSTVTKEQSFIYSNGRVENIISAKSSKLTERDHMRAYGAQNKVQRGSTKPSVPMKSLPAVYALGKAPPKPKRPPSVDIHRFRKNMKSLKDAQDGTKISRPVVPRPTLPPLRSCPSSNHAAALTQQVDEDDCYDDVGVMNPPPLPKEHPSKRREGELSEATYDSIGNICVEQAEKSKRNQESNSGKEDTNHGKVTDKKQAQKQEKIKEKKEKSKIQGPVHIIKKGKALIGLKGGKSDLPLNQEEIVEVVHSTDDFEKTESVDAGHEEIKEEKEEPGSDAESDIYDDTGVPVEVCRNDIYDDAEEDSNVYIVPTK